MNNIDYSYKAGACIIGSLLWESTDARASWRKESFGKNYQNKLIPVSLPTRYGRFSQGRNTPTMVFSSQYYTDKKFGTAYVIPYQKEHLSTDELIELARAMSFVEGSNDSKFIKGRTEWCIMLCWINPKMEEQKRERLVKQWSRQYERELTDEVQTHFKIESEAAAVFNKDGELKFHWPDELKDYDVIIATQTQPRKENNKRSTYFSTTELCHLISRESQYFINNVKNKIMTQDDSAILKSLMNDEAIIYFRNEFRNARYKALLNAEDFAPLLFVLESFGGYLAKLCESGDTGLGKYKQYLKTFLSDSPYLYTIPNNYPVHHCEFDFLYKYVRNTRNEFAHKGVYARQKTRYILELCLIFESELNQFEMEKVSNYAVSGVTTAELWQPLSFIKKEMLINSYSYLPVMHEGSWKLVSDYNLAYYLNGSEKQRGKKEGQALESAIKDGITVEDNTVFLTLEDAYTVEPDKDISEIELNNSKPILVTSNETDPLTKETVNRLHGLFTAFDLL